MRPLLLLGLFATLTPDAPGGPVPPPPAIPMRFVGSEHVLIGKVTAIEPRPFKTPAAPDLPGVEYQIAVVKIEETIHGPKGLTHVRIGLPPQTPTRFPGTQPTLALNQEAMIFLRPHPEESFSLLNGYGAVTTKTGAEVDQARRIAKLVADPATALKSKDANDRHLTAALLVMQYRRKPPGEAKEEEIPADESKLLLQTIAAGKWDPNDFSWWTMTSMDLFNALGLTEKDGWKKPADFQQMMPAAKKWLEENAGKYRVKRFVPDPRQ